MVSDGVINVATAWWINVKGGPARCGTDLFSGHLRRIHWRFDGFDGTIMEKERFALRRIIADGTDES
jgi:hypothetical protein